jgi:hypothetical protein
MKLHLPFAGAALLAATFAFAQDSSLPGKYSGNYTSGGGTSVRIVLDIKSVENGAVKGTAERFSTTRRGGQCSGEYPVEGTLKDNTLSVRSLEQGGPSGDCAFRYTAAVQGGKLVGKLGQNDLELTK